MKDHIELSPIKETPNDFEQLEERIKEAFKKSIYIPILKELHNRDLKLKNALDKDDLKGALKSGRVVYSMGGFSGNFNASISRELRQLGATWDGQINSWRVTLSSLPQSYQQLIAVSNQSNKDRMERIKQRLTKISPEEISDKVKSSDVFKKALWKTDTEVAKTLKSITVVPKLNPEDLQKIADEWQNNMELIIKDVAEDEIVKLRAKINDHIISGGRSSGLITEIHKVIQGSYNSSLARAKFIARQETSLMMTKFKETRYLKAGVKEYKWGCVTGTKNHPVRPAHRALQGKIFAWEKPPVTTSLGEPERRNNPGQDYNCRCFALPIVRFNT